MCPCHQQIIFQVAFVKLVEHQDRDRSECGIASQFADHDACSTVPDACVGTAFPVKADRVSHRLSDGFAPQLGHVLGRQSSGQPPWLDNDDLAGSLCLAFQQ